MSYRGMGLPKVAIVARFLLIVPCRVGGMLEESCLCQIEVDDAGHC